MITKGMGQVEQKLILKSSLIRSKENWPLVELNELCTMNSGGTPSRSNLSYYSGKIPWAKISDIEIAKGGSIIDTEEHISEDGLKAINNRIFPKGTLLLAMYGSVGKIAFSGKEMSTNQAILGIRIKDENILNYSYLKYWFHTIKDELLNRAVGVALQNISLGIVKQLKIPLPPLPVQKRIAEILDATDALKRKDQELLKKYDELAQAIFIDMFGDPVKNEKGWEVKKLKDLLLVNEKISYGVVQPGDNFPNGVPIIRVGNFNLMQIDKTKMKKIDPNIEKSYTRTRIIGDEILIACVGSVGKIALADISLKNFNIVRATARVRVNSEIINRKFLAFQLCQKSIQNYFTSETRTSSQPTLNIKQIEETQILLPPVEIQNKFDLLSEKLLSQIKIINNPAFENLFNTLIQKAFKGELVS